MKYPAMYVYRKTPDYGMELKYSIRSLANITNWNGGVIVVGDKEDWFSDIYHIRVKAIYGNPHKDVEIKLQSAISHQNFPSEFLYMNDDFFCTQPSDVTALHCGALVGSDASPHQRSKKLTADWLKKRGIAEPLDYELHVPMIMNAGNRLDVSIKVIPSFNGTPLLPRSIYGNLFNIGGTYYDDKKTKTDELKEGVFISTQYYISRLDTLFPKPSRFEVS